jgi:hypothetical protein
MSKGKYAKYVIEMTPDKREKWGRFPSHVGKIINSLAFGKREFKDSAIWLHAGLVYAAGAGYGAGQSREDTLPNGKKVIARAMPHAHPGDELFLYIGTDPQNPYELGGEVEFWLGEGEEAERYRFTRTTVIYVPANVMHCPHWFRRVDRPFIVVVINTLAETTGPGISDVRMSDFPPLYLKGPMASTL